MILVRSLRERDNVCLTQGSFSQMHVAFCRSRSLSFCRMGIEAPVFDDPASSTFCVSKVHVARLVCKFFRIFSDFDDTASIRTLFRLRNCFLSVFGVLRWCCSDFCPISDDRRGPGRQPWPEEEAAQLCERRAAELKRLDLCGRRPFPKVGRPTLQSLYENALILQVRTDPDSTRHITDKTVLHGWEARHERCR